MVIPYPQLVADAGGDFSAIFTITGVFSALAITNGVAAWLLTRAHAWRWHGQFVLVVALIGFGFWAWQWV